MDLVENNQMCLDSWYMSIQFDADPRSGHGDTHKFWARACRGGHQKRSGNCKYQLTI